MKKKLLGFAIVSAIAILWGCGTKFDPSNPNPPPDCTPMAVADAGGNVYFSPDPSQSKVSMIGTPARPGMQYSWAPETGLSDPNVAQPIVQAPEETIVYTVTVKSRCNTAESSMSAVMMTEGFRSGFDKIKAHNNKGEVQEYNTGYNPNFFEHYRAQYLNMPEEGLSKSRGGVFPDEFNQTPPGFFVNRQPNGSCWAEGGRSAGEAAVYYVTGKAFHFSAQRIIDCSGFGSASGGGQISIDDFLSPKGTVLESDYPYDGYDHKCSKDKSIFRNQSRQNYFISSSSGGNPEWGDMKNAFMEYGAGEICGSASALRDGGWVENPGNGGTNHCYSANGWLKGELHGHTAGEYIIVQNSWGADWGEAGQGFYRIARDGKKITSSVMTENKFPSFGSPCPPPIVDGGPDKTIKLMPGAPRSVRIGTPEIAGQTYLWTPKGSLDDAKIGMPVASPSKTQEYTVTATKAATAQCPVISAHAKVTVHVYRDVSIFGEGKEVLE